MLILLFFCKESPVSVQTLWNLIRRHLTLSCLRIHQRWLARHGREEESLKTLAWFRKLPMEDIGLQDEFTQILAVVMEERKTKGPLQQCLKKGNRIRFLIAFTIFLLQQWSGQNVCNSGLWKTAHPTDVTSFSLSRITLPKYSKPSVSTPQIVLFSLAGRRNVMPNLRRLTLLSPTRELGFTV
jgi:hypothetical protein